MDIASALLTKKAALIGGGTAATATAVTVPLVVSKNKESNKTTDKGNKPPTPNKDEITVEPKEPEKEKASDPMDGEVVEPVVDTLAVLDLDGEDFYANFNKPGYCVKKLFPGIERSNFFKDKGEVKEAPEFVTKHEIFKSEHISNACYTFNKETQADGKQRIELSVQSNTEGWLWMAGLKKVENKYKIWYKESYLKKEGEVWKVVVGHEGEISDAGGYTPKVPDFDGTNSKFKDIVKEVDRETREECTPQQDNKCQTYKARVAYWSSTGSNELMYVEHGSSGYHITRWSGKKEKIWDTTNRQRVFFDGKWHNNTQTTDKEKQKLIHVEDSKVPKKTGSWKDLSALCRGSASSDAPYTTYCAKTN